MMRSLAASALARRVTTTDWMRRRRQMGKRVQVPGQLAQTHWILWKPALVGHKMSQASHSCLPFALSGLDVASPLCVCPRFSVSKSEVGSVSKAFYDNQL